jgi:rhamnulose-1-phosphate aldolase/alcohol dehydrogenase
MDHRWNDGDAAGLPALEQLAYRSRLIGFDPGLVLWGGGNTSLKQEEVDFRGRPCMVLRVKGSGSDLRTIKGQEFPGVRLDDVTALFDRAEMADEEMVEYLSRCLVEPGSRRPSIETLLHGFLPHPHVDHTHADAILALTDTVDGKRQVESAFGAEAIWIPYRRPGFRLSKEVGEAVRSAPRARCAVLEKHGLITWGRTSRECYDATIEMITRAEEYALRRRRPGPAFGRTVRPALPPDERRRVAARLAPRLRGLLGGRTGGPGRVVLRFDDGDDVLEFACSEAGPQIALAGPATPDHLLYTRPRPLFVDPGQADLGGEAGIDRLTESVRRDLDKYAAWCGLYVKKHAGSTGVVPDPVPRVVLIPGVGMFTAWKDARHTRIVADMYHHAIAVMRAASSLSAYKSLSIQDTFDVEYWPLELYRLSLGPTERELSRRVALVTGAARGIGRAVAARLASEGCHVVVTDRDASGAGQVAAEIVERHGPDRALSLSMDVTDERSVADAFDAACLAYGGIDIVVSNAGVAHVSPIDRLALQDWRRSFDVNATGHFLVARSALRLLREQGIGGSLVFVASKNVLAPGRDFGAYSASKAAQVQLARIVAIEGGECGVRVNLINPDAVFQDSGLWSDAVREERARAHGIKPEDLEEFYRNRNLLRVRVTAEDVAEAALYFASERSSKTTGCILTVDGGVREAFPR